VNRKCPPRNTTVQLPTAYTDPERHKTQRHRRTDRQTDRRQNHDNRRSYCVAVAVLAPKLRMQCTKAPIVVFYRLSTPNQVSPHKFTKLSNVRASWSQYHQLQCNCVCKFLILKRFDPQDRDLIIIIHSDNYYCCLMPNWGRKAKNWGPPALT